MVIHKDGTRRRGSSPLGKQQVTKLGIIIREIFDHNIVRTSCHLTVPQGAE